MARLGLVLNVEEQLEQMIGLGMLPEDGKLPSEQMLARRYGVSRTTLREALRRLAARGLVVQHPGRRTRAVALEEAVTLENLGVALHGVGSTHPERRQLLEGYFALKREATVELLLACREQASRLELDRLQQACFALGEAARWEESWTALEFELLRLAARVAQRPGHLLLIHSLERAFRDMQARVRPHLDAQAVYRWAQCALHGLEEADASALKRELPQLLRACDERVLARLAPVREVADTPQASCGAAAELPDVETEPAREPGADAAVPNLSACRTGSCAAAPEAASQPEPASTGAPCQPACTLLEARGAHPYSGEERVPTSSREDSHPYAPSGSPPAEQDSDTATFTAAAEAQTPSGSTVARARGERGWRLQGDCLNGPG